jgi:hypothetical protein
LVAGMTSQNARHEQAQQFMQQVQTSMAELTLRQTSMAEAGLRTADALERQTQQNTIQMQSQANQLNTLLNTMHKNQSLAQDCTMEMNRLVNQSFQALQADTVSRNQLLIQFESMLSELQQRNEYLIQMLGTQKPALTTTDKTTSHAAPKEASVSCADPPPLANAAATSRRTSNTCTLCPARRSEAAMPEPMAPKPIKPTTAPILFSIEYDRDFKRPSISSVLRRSTTSPHRPGSSSVHRCAR